MAYTTPRTWVAGEFVDDAMLNEQVRDNLNAAFPLGVAAWTSFTPSLTQSGAVTKTVTTARYQRVGRLIIAEVYLTCTGSGTAANPVIVGLPVTASGPIDTLVGVGRVYDSSATARYEASVGLRSTTTVHFFPTSTTVADVLGNTAFTAALASGDQVHYKIAYEAAS